MPTAKFLAFQNAWASIPYALLPGRSPLHQCILLHISHMNLTRGEEDQPSAAELAELCGVTMSTFLIGVRTLEEEGIVAVERKGGAGNRYFLVLPQESEGVSSIRYRNSLCITRNYVTHNTKHITSNSYKYFESERKNGEEEGLLDPSTLPDETVSVDWIVQTYQTIAEKLHLPSIRSISAGRSSMIRRRIKSFPTRAAWQAMFDRLERSPHLSGEGWFSFSFIIESDDNFEKVTNGWMDWKAKEGKMPKNKLPEDNSFLEDLKRQGQSNA